MEETTKGVRAFMLEPGADIVGMPQFAIDERVSDAGSQLLGLTQIQDIEKGISV